eukprot:TRINITY_DN14734_c0_g1_i1.p1 TRINITY_DN14734_c0_g1~~TRINITY_DN14734_c0_g1_i1.p1  ORF type:complete len:317 (+),score=101.53 TRINITY_DN14734_c0_g1_i1:90-953(+)
MPAKAARKRARSPAAAPAAAAAEPPAEGLDLWGADAPPAKQSRLRKKALGRDAHGREAEAARRGVLAVPHGGQSYNPDPAQHQSAVQKAVGKLLREEQRQQRISQELRPRKDIKKSCVGDDIVGPDWEEEVEGEAPAPFKQPKRKTRVQRNKARRMAVAKSEKVRRKQASKLLSDANRIPELMQEIAADRKATAKKQEPKKTARRSRLNLRLGRRKFKPAALDICDEGALAPSLRQQGSKLAGVRDAVKLRFEAFQERNVIPARAPRIKHGRKHPVKFFAVTKRSNA